MSEFTSDDLSQRLAALESANDEELPAEARVLVERLNEVECAILKNILLDYSASANAETLNLFVAEAESLIEPVRAKLGVETNAEVVRIAIYAGFDEFDGKTFIGKRCAGSTLEDG